MIVCAMTGFSIMANWYDFYDLENVQSGETHDLTSNETKWKVHPKLFPG